MKPRPLKRGDRVTMTPAFFNKFGRKKYPRWRTGVVIRRSKPSDYAPDCILVRQDGKQTAPLFWHQSFWRLL